MLASDLVRQRRALALGSHRNFQVSSGGGLSRSLTPHRYHLEHGAEHDKGGAYEVSDLQ